VGDLIAKIEALEGKKVKGLIRGTALKDLTRKLDSIDFKAVTDVYFV
jgi:hypothetical protein